MSEKQNKIKSEELGMSFSTANGRLRKMIMFQLAQQCKRDNCYRCGKKIDNVDNFSIEHMKEWLHSDNPKELFFDLNNIAFSHHSCNVGARRRRSKVNSKSGFMGVSYDKSEQRNKRWKVTVYGYDSERIAIGRFETPEEAGKAYDNKMIEIFGDNAITNKSLGLL